METAKSNKMEESDEYKKTANSELHKKNHTELAKMKATRNSTL